MKGMYTLRILALGLIVAFAAPGHAASPDELIAPIQTRWAEIKYQGPEKDQAEQYHALALEAHALLERNPDSAEVLIWEGIVLSSEAGAKGGLGALSLAKQAREKLEKALELNDLALNGSAYTSLATLYAKVPGWPIGFGDEERAENYFKRSLAINPAGIDPNFFYAEYLIEHERVNDARVHLDKALIAPPRPGRELADEGRRAEIKALLATLDKDAK